jgi:hypothetical protein
MFVNLNLEKKSRYILSNYFLSIINKNLNIDPVDPDFVLLYFTLKSQFYSKYRKDKYTLKSFFTLIALEYKRYNILRFLQFKHSYKYHANFKEEPDAIPEHYIRYLKRNLYFILDFSIISVYEFFMKLFLGLGDMFREGQYRSRRKVQKNNKNIGFLVNNNEIVYNNMIKNIKCTHSFNYFVYSLRIFALRKTYYSQESYNVKTFTTNSFYSNFLEFIILFENNTLHYSNSNMVDYVNYKPNELTVFDFDYNQMLKSKCSEFFNRIEYTNLKFFNTDFWFYLVNGRVNLYSKFRWYLMREVTEKTIKRRITKKHKKKYAAYLNKVYSADIQYVDKPRLILKNDSVIFNNVTEIKENYINPNNFKLDFITNYKHQFSLAKKDYDNDLSTHPIKAKVLELFRVNLNTNI